MVKKSNGKLTLRNNKSSQSSGLEIPSVEEVWWHLSSTFMSKKLNLALTQSRGSTRKEPPRNK
jgi:hypothetical protein